MEWTYPPPLGPWAADLRAAPGLLGRICAPLLGPLGGMFCMPPLDLSGADLRAAPGSLLGDLFHQA